MFCLNFCLFLITKKKKKTEQVEMLFYAKILKNEIQIYLKPVKKDLV